MGTVEHTVGSTTRYRQGCRCKNCTTHAVDAATVSKARARERAELDPSVIPHGTDSGYQYYGCKCQACRDAGGRARAARARATGVAPRAYRRQSGLA
jgi:3D (Asp-Asp-Asp) domain-containing protein